MSHPYTDPHHAGLFQLTPTQRLMNADAFRQRRGTTMMTGAGSVESPLSGLGDSVGTVLGAAGYGRPEKEPVVSDANPPSQGVQSDGGDLYHTRDNGDGTSTSVHLGTDDLTGE
jgi:hypothetical protein